MVACPPSLAMTNTSGHAGTQQATPRPVPGPSTTMGCPDTAAPPPSGYRSPAVSCGNDRAIASKSFRMRTLAKPNAARSSGASIVQGQLVSTQRSPATGPATASSASGTDTCRQCRFTNASRASLNRANSATVNHSIGPRWPFDSRASLAFVAPISPNSTCSGGEAMEALRVAFAAGTWSGYVDNARRRSEVPARVCRRRRGPHAPLRGRPVDLRQRAMAVLRLAHAVAQHVTGKEIWKSLIECVPHLAHLSSEYPEARASRSYCSWMP